MNFFDECKQRGYNATELKLDGSASAELVKYQGVALVENNGNYSTGKTSDLAKDYCESHGVKIFVAVNSKLCSLRAFTENDPKGDFYEISGCAISLETIYTMYFIERIMTVGDSADYKVYGLTEATNE